MEQAVISDAEKDMGQAAISDAGKDMGQTVVSDAEEYETLKYELKATLDETADNFIIIGYILKQVRDRHLYLQENYSDIYGFGMGEYGLSRATVSRFMNMNTKFSVGGNSREMKPEYKGYGRSRIQEMLNVDECDMELITADTTVGQIKELKKAEEEQRRIEKEEQDRNLPLVQMSAGREENGAPAPEPMEPFEAVLTAFWKENTELYRKVAAGILTPVIAAEEISPSGSRTFRAGVNMMFFYDIDKGLKLRSYTKGRAEITTYTYQELIDRTMNLNITEEQNGTDGVSQEQKPADGIPENHNMTSGLQKESVATPQLEQEQESYEQPAYTPLPGQTSVADLQDIMQDAANESATVLEENKAPEGVPENVIDGEYRELDEKQGQEGTGTGDGYSDIEIKHAIIYFDMEYSRMTSFGHDTAKCRNYRVALECIRKCYGSIAEQVDNCLPG